MNDGLAISTNQCLYLQKAQLNTKTTTKQQLCCPLVQTVFNSIHQKKCPSQRGGTCRLHSYNFVYVIYGQPQSQGKICTAVCTSSSQSEFAWFQEITAKKCAKPFQKIRQTTLRPKKEKILFSITFFFAFCPKIYILHFFKEKKLSSFNNLATKTFCTLFKTHSSQLMFELSMN